LRTTNPIVGGTIRHVAIQIPQIFHRIDVASIEASFDTRFDYFVRTILPQCRSPGMAHCLIYVPSYFDFVRLRNHFKKEELNFVQICEYSKEGKVARARDMFYHSAAHFLLFSERQHFFKRSRVKGIRHIVFYQPPLFADFYAEMLNLMQDAYQNPRDGCDKHAMTCTVLYTKYDLQRLAALVGSEKTTKMARASKSTHMFMNETRS
jgi:U3 small nucleolar RNA-associated protein 25